MTQPNHSYSLAQLDQVDYINLMRDDLNLPHVKWYIKNWWMFCFCMRVNGKLVQVPKTHTPHERQRYLDQQRTTLEKRLGG